MGVESKVLKFQQGAVSGNYFMAASLGLIDGVSTDVKFGHSPNTTAVLSDVWEIADSQPTYIFPDAAGEGVEIVSDNVADSQQFTILGLDGATGLLKTEQVNLNGTTPVALSGTWRAINRIYNSDTSLALGTVQIQGDGGTSTNIFAVARPGAQQTSQAIYQVPADKVAVVVNLSTAANRSVGVNSETLFRLVIAKAGVSGVSRVQVNYGLQRDGTSNISSDLIIPAAAPPLAQIRVVAVPGSAPTDVSAEFSMLLIDKTLIPADVLAGLEAL